jgi:hypothetical protein
LAFDVLLGGAVYVGALFAMWSIAGRPDSPERDVLSFLQQRLKFKPAGSG